MDTELMEVLAEEIDGGSVAMLLGEKIEIAEDAARARRRRQILGRLDKADRLLWSLAHEYPPRFSRTELARRFGVGRSTLYERLARIEKELTLRYCVCGCGGELPPKSTRRRMYLDHHGGHAHVRRRRTAHR